MHVEKIPLTSRRASHEHSPIFQHLALTEEMHQLRTIKKQIIDPRRLSLLPIHARHEMHVFRLHSPSSNQTRPKRRKGIKTLAITPLRYSASELRIALPFSGRDVVAVGVGADVLRCSLEGDVAGGLAYDEAKVLFVVGLVVLADSGNVDWGAVVVDVGAEFGKEGREGRWGMACFCD
jgi:hypothetical protein